MNCEKKINDFLEAMSLHFAHPNLDTNWPLNGAQMDSYFDIDEALDIYGRLKTLRKTKSLKEISEMMPSPDIIRLFMQHNAIIGLKVAKKLGFTKISAEERKEYVCFLIDLIKEKIHGDPLCLDGKNLIWDENKSEELLHSLKWDLPSEETKKKVSFLTVMANNLAYTLYFDAYMTGGFYLHGPYDASSKFGKDTIMLVRDYHGLNPQELWPDFKFQYKSIKIISIYKNLNLKIGFVNQPITRESIGDKLIAFKIYADGEEINCEDIEKITDKIREAASSQSKKVNSMLNLDKVRKGAKISFYLFKNLREKMGDHWIPENYIEKTIEKFGESLIEKFSYNKTKEMPPLTHWKRIFDPRDDYY